MKTTSDPARWEIMKRYRCQCGSHPGGGNAIEEQQVAAQKYPKALQSRTGDKTICVRSPIHLQHEIDSAARPGHGNQLTLPSGSGPEPSIDGTRLNDWSLVVNT